MLVKRHVLLTCQGIYINLRYDLYEISYNLVCRKFLSTNFRDDCSFNTTNED
jgi:hypothetical protein